MKYLYIKNKDLVLVVEKKYIYPTVLSVVSFIVGYMLGYIVFL